MNGKKYINCLRNFSVCPNKEAMRLFRTNINYFGYQIAFAKSKITRWAILADEPKKIKEFRPDLPKETDVSDNTR